mgnify:CR=1 FL=1
MSSLLDSGAIPIVESQFEDPTLATKDIEKILAPDLAGFAIDA